MEVSKLTLSKETQNIMSRGLSYKKRMALKRNAVIDFIREKPAGTIISMQRLAAAAGITSTGGAHTFVTRLMNEGVITRTEDPERKKSYSWSVNGDVHTHTPRAVMVEKKPKTVDIVELAKRFAWEVNSDSVREFAKWAEENA